jgi:hypothetical protein
MCLEINNVNVLGQLQLEKSIVNQGSKELQMLVAKHDVLQKVLEIVLSVEKTKKGVSVGW